MEAELFPKAVDALFTMPVLLFLYYLSKPLVLVLVEYLRSQLVQEQESVKYYRALLDKQIAFYQATFAQSYAQLNRPSPSDQ